MGLSFKEQGSWRLGEGSFEVKQIDVAQFMNYASEIWFRFKSKEAGGWEREAL
ncbi:hypothetical protein [Chryseobacterium sp.]|uniref:hypothetical protein n=1 Tax=Chryseobacterium sp. TaxID=1871047 RepID=UPI00321B543D